MTKDDENSIQNCDIMFFRFNVSIVYVLITRLRQRKHYVLFIVEVKRNHWSKIL